MKRAKFLILVPFLCASALADHPDLEVIQERCARIVNGIVTRKPYIEFVRMAQREYFILPHLPLQLSLAAPSGLVYVGGYRDSRGNLHFGLLSRNPTLKFHGLSANAILNSGLAARRKRELVEELTSRFPEIEFLETDEGLQYTYTNTNDLLAVSSALKALLEVQRVELAN